MCTHLCTARVGLLFALYRPYVRRIDLDGTNSWNLYSGGYPSAVDFDYRYKQTLLGASAIMWFMLTCIIPSTLVGCLPYILM